MLATLAAVRPFAARRSPTDSFLLHLKSNDPVSALLQDLQALFHLVENVFTKVKGESATARLDGKDFERFRDEICAVLNLGASGLTAFGDADRCIEIFDFSDKKNLSRREAYEATKRSLAHLQTQVITTADLRKQVRHASIREAGYTVISKLGEGGQGSVVEAEYTDASKAVHCEQGADADAEPAAPKGRVAIKTIGLPKYPAYAAAEIMRETLLEVHRVQEFGSHPNIAKCHEVLFDVVQLHIVSELLLGDWRTLTAVAQKQGVDTDLCWYQGLFLQAAEGLKFMHEHAVTHCDIKEDNLMVRPTDIGQPQVCFIDFGLSEVAMGKDEDLHLKGTPGYIPCEVWQRKIWFPKSDVFSLATVFMQMLLPYQNGRTVKVFSPSSKGVPKTLDMYEHRVLTYTPSAELAAMGPCSQKLRRIISDCLSKGKAERYTAERLVQELECLGSDDCGDSLRCPLRSNSSIGSAKKWSRPVRCSTEVEKKRGEKRRAKEFTVTVNVGESKLGASFLPNRTDRFITITDVAAEGQFASWNEKSQDKIAPGCQIMAIGDEHGDVFLPESGLALQMLKQSGRKTLKIRPAAVTPVVFCFMGSGSSSLVESFKKSSKLAGACKFDDEADAEKLSQDDQLRLEFEEAAQRESKIAIFQADFEAVVKDPLLYSDAQLVLVGPSSKLEASRSAEGEDDYLHRQAAEQRSRFSAILAEDHEDVMEQLEHKLREWFPKRWSSAQV